MKILHIYSGSQASGGLYLKKIVDTLNDVENNVQETIVSYYYPFKSNSKVFFRFTDLAGSLKKTKLRLVLRYLELIYGLTYSFFYSLYFKPNIINYSLNSAYLVELYFLKLISLFTNSKIFITCHDVIPFKSGLVSENKDFKRRNAFFKLATKLIVHNKQSIIDLVKIYNQKEEKITFYPFPIMDLKLLQPKQPKTEKVEEHDFCFLGHLREEKGIDLLIEAWKVFNQLKPNAKLIIAGNRTSNNDKINEEELRKINITLIDRYVSDAMYLNIIESSKCIILPYLKGTNSGILSTIISVNINIIASDIELFKDHFFINKNNIFQSGNQESLIEKLSLVYNAKLEKTERLNKIEEYNRNFKKNILKAYQLK